MTKDDWQRILGFVPNLELKKLILQTVKDEGISIKEAAARYSLPPLIIDDVDEPDPDYDNEFRPPVIIH